MFNNEYKRKEDFLAQLIHIILYSTFSRRRHICFLIFLFIYIASFRFYFIKLNSSKNQKYKYAFLLCLITFSTNFWPLAPSANFFNNWINMIIYLPLGF